MANIDDSRKIQKMVRRGKVAAGEARRGPFNSSSAGRGNGPGRQLRIHVIDVATGHSKALVQIPVALVDAGMKIGAQFAPNIEGVDMIKVQDAIRAGAMGKILDVTDYKCSERVEISVE